MAPGYGPNAIADVTYKVPLTEFSLAYESQSFIGERLFPVVPKNSRSGFYWKYGREGQTPELDYRAPSARANETTHTYTREEYLAYEHALIEPVSHEVRDEARALNAGLDPYYDATQVVTEKIALRRELEISQAVRDPNQITQNTTLSGAAQWSSATGSTAATYSGPDILANIWSWKETVRTQIGMYPNTIVIPPAVMRVMRFNAMLLDKVSITGTKRLTPEVLQDLFEIDEILIPAAQYNSANRAAPPVMVDVWGKDVLLAYVNPQGAGQRTMNLGLTIRVNFGDDGEPIGDRNAMSASNAAGADAFGADVNTWTEQDRHSDFVEVRYLEARKVAASMAGFLAKNVVS